MIMLILYLGLAIAVGYGTYWLFPNATRRWFYRIQAARKTVFSLLYLMTMVTLFISGVAYLVLIAIAMGVIAFWTIVFERPQEAL